MPRVVIPGAMRHETGGLEVVEVEGGTLRQVMRALGARYPGLGEKLLEADGSLRPFIALFVDGVEVRWSEGLYMPVGAGTEIVIVPALSGGA